MEYRRLGKSDLKVSVIGLGAWQYGTREWGYGWDFTREDAIRTMHRALELGINWIDTAEVYGNGESERIVGEAIRGRREEVIVATKVWVTHLRYDDVVKAAEGSLRRLGVDCIDLYQVHWPNAYVPVSETMRAMDRLAREGKIWYVGVSNSPPCLVREALESLSYTELLFNQVLYNMIQRDIEKEIKPFCDENGITVIAYSPLAQGLLTGKYSRDRLPSDEVRRGNPLFSNPENLEQALRLVEVLRDIARGRGKTVSQVALNWLIRDPNVVAIPGAKRPS